MMYSEFLELAKCTENQIPYSVYAKNIEPMYMAVDIDKKEFIKYLNIKNIIGMTENPERYAKEIAKFYSAHPYNFATELDLFDEYSTLLNKYANIKGASRAVTTNDDLENGTFELYYNDIHGKLKRTETYKIVKNTVKFVDSMFF